MERARRNRARPWRCLLVAALLFSIPADAAAQETRVRGTEARRIDEPVFGGQMVVYEAGRGNARGIMLVHGIGQEGARDFRDHITWLQKSFHVVAVDLPGFGQSDKANVLYSPANYALVLKHVAGRFLHGPFALVGHSMGAVVSLRYAATYPDDVQRLVVVDAPGILHRSSTTSQFLAHFGLEFVPPATDPDDWLVNLARKLLAPLQQLHLDPQIILSSAQLRQKLLGADPAKIAGLAVASENLQQELPKVRAETLIVWGAQDTLAPLRTGRVLALKLPRARLAVIERAGHELMLEAPERFRAVLEPFLERGLPPAPARAAAPLAKRGEGTCRNERNKGFHGEDRRVILDGCRHVQIRNAPGQELHVLDSTVTIDDSSIGGGATRLPAYSSTLVMTGGRIEGNVAITASGSRLDLAAVEVEGREAAVTARQRSYVVFSLCPVRSPRTRGDVHDFYAVTENNPL